MVTLTEKAAEIVKKILEENNQTESYLRLAILTGGCGCSGQKYGLFIDDKKEENDLVFDSHGVKIVIDPISYDEVKGTTIDYIKDELFGEGFKIINPNEKCSCEEEGSCGCN